MWSCGAAALLMGMAQIASATVIVTNGFEGTGTAYTTSSSGVAPSTTYAHNGTHSLEMNSDGVSSGNVQAQFAVSPGTLTLGQATGSFWAYMPSNTADSPSAHHYPYMYFGLDTNGDGSADSFVIAWTSYYYIASDTWTQVDFNGSSPVHVAANRPGLNPDQFNDLSATDTLGALDAMATGLGGTWGDLDVVQVKIGFGAGQGTGYVDDVNVDGVVHVPEPGALALFGLGLGLILFLAYRRRGHWA